MPLIIDGIEFHGESKRTLPPSSPVAPKERIEYFGEDGSPGISEFYEVWTKADRPPLQEGWRSPAGGCVWWWWFRDPQKQAHALSVANAKSSTDADELTMLARMGRRWVHSKD